MPPTELDLDRLRSEMMDYMRDTGLPIFYAVGAPEEDDYIFWDTGAFPDWRQFVDVAKESGARLLVFCSQALTDGELEQAMEKLSECDLNREESGFYLKQFEALRRRIGQTAWVRIGFEHSGRWLAYELSVPWHDEFRSAVDDLEAFLPMAEEEEEEEGDSGRGFFSRN